MSQVSCLLQGLGFLRCDATLLIFSMAPISCVFDSLSLCRHPFPRQQ